MKHIKMLIILIVGMFLFSGLGAQYSPGGISSNLSIWYDANTLQTSLGNNSEVQTWSDRSGNGFDATQTSSSNRPLFKTNIFNGKPALRFDGTNDYLSTTLGTAISQPLTVFVYMKLPSNNNAIQNVFDAIGTNRVQFNKQAVDNRFRMYSGTIVDSDVSGYAGGNAYVTLVFNGVSSVGRFNGTQVFSSDPGSNSLGSFYIGARQDLGSGVYLNSDIAEFIVYSAALNSTQISAVESYLATKYNTNELYFRSQASGNWTSETTWESSSDGITWADATYFPTAFSTAVYIRTGDTVTLDVNSECNNLIMDGGILDINSKTLSINGVLTQNSGTISNGNPNADGYESTNNYLEINESGNLISGFTASTSATSTLPSRINRAWTITGTFSGSKTVTFYWDAADDDSFNWGSVIPAVYKGGTKYSQTAYDVSSDPRYITVSLPDFAAKGNYTVGGSNDETLPVELSSFTVSISAYNQVTLQWITQSETNVSGFRIYRNTENNFANAEMLNMFIPGTNTSQTQVYQVNDEDLFEPGTYYYWLMVQDMDGGVAYHGPTTVYFDNSGNSGIPGIPVRTGFTSVYPNPFNPSTTISYGITKAGDVNFKIYNQKGQLVKTYNEAQKAIGYWKLDWDGTDFNGRACPTGVYYVKMHTGNQDYLTKAVLLK